MQFEVIAGYNRTLCADFRADLLLQLGQALNNLRKNIVVNFLLISNTIHFKEIIIYLYK